MAASILLLNPNRHRASDKLTKSANRNPVENNMCRNPKDNNNSKNPMKEKTKTHLDFSDLLIENAHGAGDLPVAVTRAKWPHFGLPAPHGGLSLRSWEIASGGKWEYIGSQPRGKTEIPG
jgi:hypothetical protein